MEDIMENFTATDEVLVDVYVPHSKYKCNKRVCYLSIGANSTGNRNRYYVVICIFFLSFFLFLLFCFFLPLLYELPERLLWVLLCSFVGLRV